MDIFRVPSPVIDFKLFIFSVIKSYLRIGPALSLDFISMSIDDFALLSFKSYSGRRLLFTIPTPPMPKALLGLSEINMPLDLSCYLG